MKLEIERSSWSGRLLLALGGSLLLAMLVAVGFYNSKAHSDGAVELPGSLLFQLRADDGEAILSAAISSSDGDWLVLPSDLTVDDSTLSKLADGLDPRRPGTALAEDCGVYIDDTWQLDRLGLAALLDSVGGIYLTPAEAVRIESPGSEPVEIAAGETRYLTGSLASAYVVGSTPEQLPTRFTVIWQQLMDQLDGAKLPQIVQAVGSTSHSTLTVSELVAVIERLQQIDSVTQLNLKELTSRIEIHENGLSRVLSDSAIEALKAAGMGEPPSA